MTQSKPNDQEKPSQPRTVLLAVDLKNSVLAELDAGNPNCIAYSPYGHQSAQHGVMSRLGFNGERREAIPEWYFLGNGYRVYNPRLMRFHSPDSLSPFGKGGLNAYVYCGGEPVMNSDPTGHFFFRVIVATVAAAVVQRLDDSIPLFARLTVDQSASPITTISQRIKNLGIATRFKKVVTEIPFSNPGTGPKVKQQSLYMFSDRPSSFGSGSSSSSGSSGYANRTSFTKPQPRPQYHGYAHRTSIPRNETKPPRITSTTAGGIRKEK